MDPSRKEPTHQLPAPLADWRQRFHLAGLAGQRGTPLASEDFRSPDALLVYRDASGQHHWSNSALLARLLGVSQLPAPPASASADARLWHAALDPALPTYGLFSDDPGPLWPNGAREGIESWTLTELRGLHALWWIAALRNDAPLRQRALDAAAWHVAELQPDNATNRPWAAHVFVVLSMDPRWAHADLHAQTLYHNALMTGGGTPEAVSAAILLDAAEALALEAQIPLPRDPGSSERGAVS